jgi:surfactin family lipopeptide synthetase C
MNLNFESNSGTTSEIVPTSAACFQSDDAEGAFPLSPAQARMLSHSLLAQNSGVYLEQIICRADGELDPPAFEQAWQRAVECNDILRTSYRSENLDEPLQVVEPDVTFPFHQYEWRGLSETEQEKRLELLLREDRAAGFNFSRAPLARLALIRVKDDSYLFVWSIHSSLLDGWSQALVLKQVFTTYKALARGEQPRVRSSRPYRDYIEWLLAQDLTPAKDFWTRTLQGLTAPTALGIDQRPQGSQSEGISYEDLELSLTTEETARLQSFARQNRLTMFTLVQGAWALLLSRYSGSDDVVYGTTVSVRPPDLPNIESTAGLFINTIPVRARLSAGDEIISWLKEIQIEAVEEREYQHTPLVLIQRWSEVARGLELFNSILVFQNFPIEDDLYDLGDRVRVRRVRWILCRTHYPLALLAMPGSELGFRFVYDGKRFERDAIQRMLEHLRTILEEIVTGPTRKLAEFRILMPKERQRLFVGVNSNRKHRRVGKRDNNRGAARRVSGAQLIDRGTTRTLSKRKGS